MKVKNKVKAIFLATLVFLVSVSATPAATDLGGQTYKPTAPCAGGENILYRYIARTLGGKPRIDEFCFNENYADKFVNQPLENMQGSCPADECGTTTANRRGPIEYALFRAVASLERNNAVRMKVMMESYQTSYNEYSSGIITATARFQLDNNSRCITEVMSYDEYGGSSSAWGSAVTESTTISNGVVWVEQKYVGGTYNLLVMVEVEHDGIYEAEFSREVISCQSTTGPIMAQELSFYDFKAERINLQEWAISAYYTPKREEISGSR